MSFDTDIDALYATYKRLLPMAQADEDRLWQKFRLDWNYNSNRIEGNTLTYGETEALLILGTEPKRLQRDIREMKAHDLGIEYLQGLTTSRRYITEANIRELNQIILKQNYWIETETAEGNISCKEIVPGTYKNTPNHVRLRGGGVHKFAEPQDVPARMANTVKSIRAYIKKPDAPLSKFLAELHHDFINTHPFDDGNGRVCRMLLNYVCLKLIWPPVIIKDKNKDDYLVALEQADTGDLSALEAMMHGELEWSLKKAIAAAKGEDIEDADDVDKEIDFFVRENESIYSLPVTVKKNIKRIFEDYITPTVKRLDELLNKFESLFEEVSFGNSSMSIKDHPLYGYPVYTKIYTLKHLLKQEGCVDLEIYLSCEFEDEDFQVCASVRDVLKNEDKEIIFTHDCYDDPFDSEAVDKFCSEIGHAVLDIVKDYQQNATE